MSNKFEISSAYVYIHTRLDTGAVFYIGISAHKPYYRAATKSGRTEFWSRIASKAGYSIDIILNNITYEKAKEQEQLLIGYYGSIKNGGTLCNLTLGGDGTLGYVMTDTAKENLRQLRTGKKLSKEQIAILVKANKGKTISDYQKECIRQANKARVYTSEMKQKWVGVNNPIAKQVFDPETGIYYDTVKEACNAKGVPKHYFSRNKTNLIQI